MASRPAWLLLAVALLAAGCGANPDDGGPGEPCSPHHYKCMTAPDTCLQVKIGRLSSIDHEQPSAEALAALIEFCERQYGAPAEAGRGRFRPDYIPEETP